MVYTLGQLVGLALGEEPGFDKGENTKAFKEISRILESAKKRNLLSGIHNGTIEYAQKMISKGFNLVTVGSDQRFMSMGAKNVIETIKGKKNYPSLKVTKNFNEILCLYAQNNEPKNHHLCWVYQQYQKN